MKKENNKKERIKKREMIFLFLIFGIILISLTPFISSSYSSSSSRYTSPGMSSYNYLRNQNIDIFPMLDEEKCGAGQDFLIQVSPLGCSPIVRSDLLEEQNVPVFCPIMATKLNPLIDVEAINSLYFKGNYPKEVSGIGFHPAQAALSTGYRTMLNSPVLNNIGYAVIVFKKQANESSMPDYVEGTVTATIKYDITKAFGVGRSEYYLPVLSDSEWNENYEQYSFWKGKGYLRADSVGLDEARISIYRDKDTKQTGTNLKVGGESETTYIPGYYCLAGVKIRLSSLESYDTYVRIEIDGEYYEVKKGEKFLENKCEVRGIKKNGLNEEVNIYCSVDVGDKSIELIRSPTVKLSIDGQEEKDFILGDVLSRQGDRNIFLGYIGKTTDNQNFVLPVISTHQTPNEFLNSIDYELAQAIGKSLESTSKVSGISWVDSVINAFKSFGKGLFQIAEGFAKGTDYGDPIFEGESNQVEFISKNIKDRFSALFSLIQVIKGDWQRDYPNINVRFIGFSSANDLVVNNEFQSYYDKSETDYLEIIEDYSGETISGIKETYAEKDLIELIRISYITEQKKTMLEYCDLFKQKYSDSLNQIKEYCDDSVFISNSNTSEADISINGELRHFSFKGIREPRFEEYGAVVSISGAQEGYNDNNKQLKKGQRVYLSDEEFFELTEVGENYIKIKPQINKEKTGEIKIELDRYDVLGNKYEIRLNKVNLEKVAKVTLVPNIRYTETEANFTFKIGIEKRAIQLTPDQIQSKIENLDEQISKWSVISERLDETVQGLKKVCLGTGIFLTAKNFLSDSSGKAIARQQVMRSQGGWYDICAKEVEAKRYPTIDACLLDKSDEIDKDVNFMASAINSQNEQIKNIQTYETSSLGGKIVNEEKFVEDYCGSVKDKIPSDLEGINHETIKDSFSVDGWKNGNFYKDDCRNVELYSNILNSNTASSELKEIARKELTSTLTRVQTNSNQFVEINSVVNNLESTGNIQDVGVSYIGDKNAKPGYYEGGITTNFVGNIRSDTPVQMIVYNSEKYLAELELVDVNKYRVKNIFDINGYSLDNSGLEEQIKSKFSYFEKFDRTSYENKYLNAEVKYYETGQFKGYPAIVPFDTRNGWYAATRETLPGLSGRGITPYDESGRVVSFWIGNVGKNGRQQFTEQSKDDILMQFNPASGEIYGTFPGLDEAQTQRLVRDAVNAISSAQRDYKSGVKSIRMINGEKINVGEPSVNVPSVQCQDFMSPKECNLLFNVCDPVICPSSRCNLGGNYYVEDVIQTGIIGGLTLCFPNKREGIIVPVCLSGINAGVDGLLKMVGSYRDCLQESLDTGKQVGICDQIHSIYVCEFLWRQATPFARAGIPSLLSWISGQGTRGGGEYMALASAWDNAASSVDYFINYYGANSYQAFKVRSTDDVGTEVCKKFASEKYPTSSDFIDALTTPDSPIQYTSWFEEIPFTTATNPPISHYKVFYHIYAGKDIGHYFKIYLKSPSGSSLYQNLPTITISQGYVGIGEVATESIDLTGASGYRELCVNIDGQDDCGFKQVTTSFAQDYIKDKYIEEQTTSEVTSESECVSGSPSWYGLLNVNVEEGLSEALNPELSSKGIVRVCSTDNPGQGTNEQRWTKVGYCTDKSVGCWLDSQSVKDAVSTKYIEEGILEQTSSEALAALRKEGNYYTEEESNSQISELRKIIGKDLTGELINEEELIIAITNINSAYEKVLLSNEKVQLIDLRARAYAKLARRIYGRVISERIVQDIEKQMLADYEGIEEDKINSLVNEYNLSDSQKNSVLRAKTCEDCGKAIAPCKEEECSAIGNFLGINCIFTKKNIGGNCSTKKTDALSGVGISENYKERYENYYKQDFETYSSINLPSGWEQDDFKALLVAIAQQETSLGIGNNCGPEGNELCTNLLMGYDPQKTFGDSFRGARKQIAGASLTLKKAFNKENNNYAVCNSKTDNAQIECILSVYYSGKYDSDGTEYARNVLDFWERWKTYFKGVNEAETDAFADKISGKTRADVIEKVDLMRKVNRDLIEVNAIIYTNEEYYLKVSRSGENIVKHSTEKLDYYLKLINPENNNVYLIESEDKTGQTFVFVLNSNLFLGIADYHDYEVLAISGSDYEIVKGVINVSFSGELTQGSRGTFSDAEIENIRNAEECSDCGKGNLNSCDEDECIAIGDEINKNCVWQYNYNQLAPNYNCVENKTEEKSETEESYVVRFTDTELQNIDIATSCDDCGKGFWNTCDKNECEAIGEKIGRVCEIASTSMFSSLRYKCEDRGERTLIEDEYAIFFYVQDSKIVQNRFLAHNPLIGELHFESRKICTDSSGSNKPIFQFSLENYPNYFWLSPVPEKDGKYIVSLKRFDKSNTDICSYFNSLGEYYLLFEDGTTPFENPFIWNEIEMDISFRDGATENDYSLELTEILYNLKQNFGSPLNTDKINIIIVSDVETNKVVWTSDPREVYLSEINLARRGNLEGYIVAHELFHALYQTDNFLSNNPDFIIEGLATYSEYKYKYYSLSNEKISKKLSEFALFFKKNKNLGKINPSASFDPNPKYNDYSYIISGLFFFEQNNLDKEKIRSILLSDKKCNNFNECLKNYNLQTTSIINEFISA